MAGVMIGFAEHVDPALGAHLMLAGPAVTGVADDPEGDAVLAECIALWRTLPHAVRSRVHLACAPMANARERAAAEFLGDRHLQQYGTLLSRGCWPRPRLRKATSGVEHWIFAVTTRRRQSDEAGGAPHRGLTAHRASAGDA
jgi:trehalose synthase